MANNRDLLREAIADAKAVKEMAIANAKAALEEAFTPQLQSMLSAKLQEMEEEEELDEVGFGKMTADSDEGFSEMGEKALDETDDLDEEYMDLDELLNELNEEEEEEDEMENEEEGEPLNLEDMTDDDLKKFIEDVIADMVKAGELEGEIETDEEDVDLEGDEESDDDVEIEVEDEEEVTIDEGLLDFLKKKKEAAPSKETDPNPVIGVDYDGNYIRKDGTMAEGAKQGYNAKLDDAEGAKHGKKKQDMKQRRADSENMEKADGKRKFAGDSQMKEEEEMAEMRLEVNELKSELNEVNLLNAKLLYVNKIFRAKNLNENQKAKVLGAFDKATSVTEVKLVFETLSEGLTPVKSAIKENRGSASRIMGNSTTKKPILEVNNQFERWQKLAGIK